MTPLATLKGLVARPGAPHSGVAAVLGIAAAPSRERGRYAGFAYAHAVAAVEAQRVLAQAFQGTAARLGSVDVHTFKPGDLTARDPLQAQARVDFTDATRADIDLLRNRATEAYVPRGRATHQQLVDGLNDRVVLRCPTFWHWRKAAQAHGGFPDWAIYLWFGGGTAPEAVERDAYALMRAENVARARLR